jgi:SAM-dependent methyltransferase
MIDSNAARSARLARLASSEPSRFLHRFASVLDAGLPVLDAPCGFGRNSLLLVRQGYEVVGTDINRGRIDFLRRRAESDPLVKKNLNLVACDLNAQSLPFQKEIFGTLIIVHFVPRHWKIYLALLRTGGCLVFETMGGQGGNYLQLPLRGQMREVLEPSFTISTYQERPVGPPERNAVTVRLVARKV